MVCYYLHENIIMIEFQTAMLVIDYPLLVRLVSQGSWCGCGYYYICSLLRFIFIYYLSFWMLLTPADKAKTWLVYMLCADIRHSSCSAQQHAHVEGRGVSCLCVRERCLKTRAM